MKYLVRRSKLKPALKGEWESPTWEAAEVIHVNQFHPKGSDHRPVTEARMLYDETGIYVIFRVIDRYVRATRTRPQDSVCLDSCVEFFVEPRPGKGYFNFEVNCSGTLLLHYNEAAKDTGRRGNKATPVTEELTGLVKIYHSMPGLVLPEVASQTEWRIEYFAPFRLFEHYVGPLKPIEGSRWRGNFYKCGDETSHPHWASWSSIGEMLSFHQPAVFAPLEFENSLDAHHGRHCKG